MLAVYSIVAHNCFFFFFFGGGGEGGGGVPQKMRRLIDIEAVFVLPSIYLLM